MKLRVTYFAFASVWHSVLGQEQSTFLRGSGVEGAVAEEDKRAPFGGIFNSHEHQPPSFFEDDREGVITEIVGGVPVDPREYKVRMHDSKAVMVKSFVHPLNQLCHNLRHVWTLPHFAM